MFDNYTPEEIQLLLNQSLTIKDFLSKLGYINVSGGSLNRKLKLYVEEHNLNMDNIKSTQYKISPPTKRVAKRDLIDYLNNKFPIASCKLKIRLLRENIFIHECSKCKNTTWNGENIPLQLDHIDGNSSNNNLSNLRLLCPNCHAQTDTYCGKNIKNKKTCETCDTIIKGYSKYCKNPECKPKISRDKKCNLTTNEIYNIFLENGSNYSKTAKLIGISDNAIRHRFKRDNLI